MKFARRSKVGSAIPTASMADISFLLLVFFMVSTVFVRHHGIPVKLPEAEKIEKLEMRRHVTSIWIGTDGVINIDDHNLGLDQVRPVIEGKLLANPRLVIALKADAAAAFGVVSDILQELRKANAFRVNFATSRERPEVL